MWREYVYNGEVMAELATSAPGRVLERMNFPYRMEDAKTVIVSENDFPKFDAICEELRVPYWL